jgi:hypothetical protein
MPSLGPKLGAVGKPSTHDLDDVFSLDAFRVKRFHRDPGILKYELLSFLLVNCYTTPVGWSWRQSCLVLRPQPLPYLR